MARHINHPEEGHRITFEPGWIVAVEVLDQLNLRSIIQSAKAEALADVSD
jgi:hypothetical protein